MLARATANVGGEEYGHTQNSLPQIKPANQGSANLIFISWPNGRGKTVFPLRDLIIESYLAIIKDLDNLHPQKSIVCYIEAQRTISNSVFCNT